MGEGGNYSNLISSHSNVNALGENIQVCYTKEKNIKLFGYLTESTFTIRLLATITFYKLKSIPRY